MSSLEGILSIARSALVAQRNAMEVVGHNVANAQTAGYSRQRGQLTAGTPQNTPQGTFGTGVTLTTVLRVRDVLLDQQVRQQTGASSNATTRSDLLGTIEGVFGEPSPSGLASALDAFWNSWSDLATDPSNSAAKAVVQQAGAAVAGTFNRYADQLADLGTSTRSSISDGIRQVNQLAAQIASVNAAITPAEAGGNTANDLRDERDRLIDTLGALIPITVIDRPNGSDQVMIGGMPLVEGTTAKSLVLGGGQPLTLRLSGDSDALRSLGGKLGAMLDVVNTDLPGVQSGLDALASSLIGEVNALHATGWSVPSGAAGNWNPAAPPTGSGVLFFDATAGNANARGIQLSAPVAANSAAIAAGSTLNATGDNSIALGIAGLRDFAATAPGTSFGIGYRSLVTSLASGKSAATDSATVYDTLAQQAVQRRQAVDGVSLDEEMVSLVSLQQAFGAASKIVQTVDQMMQVLLGLKQ
ncbi:MAG: flagellar hook-associated protein FlgK [Gemmatimonadaceae bacterium]